MIRDLQSFDDISAMLGESLKQPVFLFKHSTACPASADAWKTFQSFAEETKGAAFWRVLVRENRDISLEIAEAIKIEHQSPQVILIREGKGVWNVTHRAITHEALAGQLESSGD